MTDMAQDPAFWSMRNMKRVMVDCNTCNTENFGIDTTPIFTDKVKAFTLTAKGYPSVDGFTKRTYLIEYEEI